MFSRCLPSTKNPINIFNLQSVFTQTTWSEFSALLDHSLHPQLYYFVIGDLSLIDRKKDVKKKQLPELPVTATTKKS